MKLTPEKLIKDIGILESYIKIDQRRLDWLLFYPNNDHEIKLLQQKIQRETMLLYDCKARLDERL
jgi:hypothetical protein